MFVIYVDPKNTDAVEKIKNLLKEKNVSTKFNVQNELQEYECPGELLDSLPFMSAGAFMCTLL